MSRCSTLNNFTLNLQWNSFCSLFYDRGPLTTEIVSKLCKFHAGLHFHELQLDHPVDHYSQPFFYFILQPSLILKVSEEGGGTQPQKPQWGESNLNHILNVEQSRPAWQHIPGDCVSSYIKNTYFHTCFFQVTAVDIDTSRTSFWTCPVLVLQALTKSIFILKAKKSFLFIAPGHTLLAECIRAFWCVSLFTMRHASH